MTLPFNVVIVEDAPCANVCPVGAISQIDNTIIVDEGVCKICKTCMMACPFGAMDLVPLYQDGEVVMQVLQLETEDGFVRKKCMVANKCDLCTGRAGGPACVESCLKSSHFDST